jgi:hypothetical protein
MSRVEGPRPSPSIPTPPSPSYPPGSLPPHPPPPPTPPLPPWPSRPPLSPRRPAHAGRQRAARPGTRMQETDHGQMTLICRGNPKGPNGMLCRTVHNGAVQRVNHLSTPFHYGMLDAVSGSAKSGSTSEQRVEEHNPQPYRVGFEQLTWVGQSKAHWHDT